MSAPRQCDACADRDEDEEDYPVDDGCWLCWMVDRLQKGSPLEVGLCYAMHIGAVAASGATVTICERHQVLVDKTGRDFVEAQASGGGGGPS